MKGIVLCGVLLVFLARNQSHGASTDMEFMKDPNFPGNPLWMKNLEESLPMNKPGFPGSPEWNRKLEEEMSGPDFPGSPEWQKKLEESMSGPDFPGSPEWQKKLEESMSGPDFPGSPEWQKKLEESINNSMASANTQAADSYTGSSVVTPIGSKIGKPSSPKVRPVIVKPLRPRRPVKPSKPFLKPTTPVTFVGDEDRNIMTPTVATSTIGGKISQPRFPKIKPIKPPKIVKPIVVKPIVVKPRKPLLKPTPSLTTPVTTFVGDKDIDNSMASATTQAADSFTGFAPGFVISPAVQNAPSPVTPTVYKGPKNMKIPHAPQNFPFPPDCIAVPDPGYKFGDLTVLFKNNNIGNQTQVTETKHRSFLCTDPEYGQDSFYMQITEYSHGTNSGVSRSAIYYDKTGKKIDYSRKMVMLPLGESLPDTPRNDYLGMDVTF